MDKNNFSISGIECGKIEITVYKDTKYNRSFFYIIPTDANLLPIVDSIDEALSKYKE